jgi:metal-responsive CopG/Arc/MetJ family transcriptional regulator
VATTLKESANHQSKPMPRKTKKKVSLSIDSGLLDWVDQNVANFTFQNRSHAVEQAIYRMKKETNQ